VKRVLLGLLVLALAATGLWMFRHQKRAEVRGRLSEARLLEFDDREVTALEIATPRARWRLDRGDEGWTIGTPVRDVADTPTIASLMTALRLSPVVRTIEQPDALATYGLEPAAAEIVLEGVEAPRVWLGTVVPTLDGVFARVEGREGVLVLVLSLDGYQAATNPVVLRQHAVVDLTTSSVVRAELRVRGEKLVLGREEDGWWTVEPRRLPASDGAVSTLIETLTAAQVAGFLDGSDPDDPGLGLGPESLEILLVSPSATRTVRLGTVVGEGDRAVKRADRESVLLVALEDLAELQSDLGSYLGERLTRVNRYNVLAFRYTAEGGNVEARRQGADGAWESGGSTVPDDEVYLLLARLLEMRGSWLARKPGSGGGPPAAVLEFETGNGVTDRIEYRPDGTATVGSVPDGTFTASSPPPAPRLR